MLVNYVSRYYFFMISALLEYALVNYVSRYYFFMISALLE